MREEESRKGVSPPPQQAAAHHALSFAPTLVNNPSHAWVCIGLNNSPASIISAFYSGDTSRKHVNKCFLRRRTGSQVVVYEFTVGIPPSDACMVTTCTSRPDTTCYKNAGDFIAVNITNVQDGYLTYFLEYTHPSGSLKSEFKT